MGKLFYLCFLTLSMLGYPLEAYIIPTQAEVLEMIPKMKPMPSKNVCIPANLKFSLEDFQLIKRGIFPETMDDRWIIYSRDNRLCLHRSWTLNMIYEYFFEEHDNDVVITGFYANRDEKHYTNTDDECDLVIANNLLEMVLDANKNPEKYRSYETMILLD